MIENEVKEGAFGEICPEPAPTGIRKKKKRFFTIRTLFIVFALSPALIHLAIFWFGVQIETLKMAFTEYGTDKFIGWDNFDLILDYVKQGSSDLGSGGNGIRNTFIFFGISMCMMPVSLFAVYLIYKQMFGHRVIRVLLYLPGAISGLMMALLFKDILSPEGFLGDLLINKWGWGEGRDFFITDSTALWAIVIYDIWMSIGGNMVIWLGAMGRIPPDVIEYGKLDGVGPVREFFQIILPLIWPTFCTMLTLAIIGIFGSSGSVMVFTAGGHGTMTISYWLYHVVYAEGAEPMQHMAVAGSLIITVLTVPIVIVGRWFMNKFGEAVQY